MTDELPVHTDPHFIFKAEAVKNLAFVNYLIAHTDDEELLLWVRNRVQKPFAVIMGKLARINPDKYDTNPDKKDLRKSQVSNSF